MLGQPLSVDIQASAEEDAPAAPRTEQGQREPYWQVVFRLAAALGVRCEAFADCAGAELPAKGTKTRTHAPARRTPMTPKPARKTKGGK